MATETGNDRGLSIDAVDQRSPWRVGWPRLRAQRMLTKEASEFASQLRAGSLNALRQRVSTILDNHQVSRRDIGQIVYRTHKKFGENPPREHLRLLVDCRYDPEHVERGAWLKATIDIHKAIQDILGHHQPAIGVELCDMKIEASLHISGFPLGSKEFQRNWSDGANYRQQVHSVLRNHPNIWRSLLPTGLEGHNEQSKYHECVVWIDAEDAEDPAWLQVEQDLQSLLLPQGVSVEIWQSSGSFLLHTDDITCSTTSTAYFVHSESTCPTDLQEQLFEWPPRIGNGIGVLGEKELGGTLGGYVRVKQPKNGDDGTEHTYAVTNAHVVLGGDPSTLKHLLVSNELPSSVGQLAIQSSFEKDRHEYIGRLERFIHAHQDHMEDLQKKLLCFENDESAGRKVVQHTIEKHKAKIDFYVSQTRTARSQNLRLGHLKAAAFGKRPHYRPTKFLTPLAMDVALVDATDSVPHPEEVLMPDHQTIIDRTFASWVDVEDVFAEANHEGEDQMVAKVGRTSNFTQGKLQGIKADVNLSKLGRDISQGSGEEMASAWAVRSFPGKTPFSLPGDSGSFVFTTDSWRTEGFKDVFELSRKGRFCVLGLLFSNSMDADLAYFIPFEAVKEEIEALTGGEVIWPVKGEVHRENVNQL